MLAILALALPLGDAPLAPPAPARQALVPARLVVRDPRMPVGNRHARRRAAALA